MTAGVWQSRANGWKYGPSGFHRKHHLIITCLILYSHILNTHKKITPASIADAARSNAMAQASIVTAAQAGQALLRERGKAHAPQSPQNGDGVAVRQATSSRQQQAAAASYSQLQPATASSSQQQPAAASSKQQPAAEREQCQTSDLMGFFLFLSQALVVPSLGLISKVAAAGPQKCRSRRRLTSS